MSNKGRTQPKPTINFLNPLIWSSYTAHTAAANTQTIIVVILERKKMKLENTIKTLLEIAAYPCRIR